jgi:hypothetical protein
MIKKWRALLGFGVMAISLVLAGVLYRWFPATAGAVRRLTVSLSLIMPLYMVGMLILDSSRTTVGGPRMSRLLLGGAMSAFLGMLGATSLLNIALSPTHEVAFAVTLLLLVFSLLRLSKEDRHSSDSAGYRAR